MREINRHQHVLQRGHWRAEADVLLTEAAERERTHFHDAVQLVHSRLPGIPQMRQRVSGTGRPCIVVGDVVKALCLVFLQNASQRGAFIGGFRKMLVAIQDGALVPLADACAVGAAEIDRAVIADRDVGRRVIHHRRATARARREVVLQAERVSDFVRGKLAQPCERHFEQPRVRLTAVARAVGLHQPLGDHEILPHAERA